MNSSKLDAKVLESSKWWMAAGIFLFVLGAYVVSSPGRIDLIDGQVRFDVAYNWLTKGRPLLGDPWVAPMRGVWGQDGFAYSYYGAPASLFAMPLIWLGGIGDLTALERSRFLFSMTSPIFGALIFSVLFLFYVELRVPFRQAVAWTMVSSFATFMWPASNSSFDNAQHAFFSVSAMYFGFLSARHRSRMLAMLAGLLAGTLIVYQPYLFLIIPGLAVSTLTWTTPEVSPGASSPRFASNVGKFISGPFIVIRSALHSAGEARESCIRLLFFLSAISIDLALYFSYNHLRFGSYLDDGKLRMQAHSTVSLFGNPLSGFLTLFASPGKSIFLYSPPLILGLLGMRYLWRRSPSIVLGVFVSSVVLVLFVSCISFVGGDWCWGPRYLVVVLPLWALGFPFLSQDKFRRELRLAVVSLGVVIQLLGLSVEHQRFFFERGFNDFFWAEDSWVYFKHSALFARVEETISLRDGPPPTARRFNSLPVPDWATYSALGPPPNMPRRLAPEWIRNFKIYFLPRPWPLWMLWIKPGLRPINLQAWILSLVAIMMIGGASIYRGLRTLNTGTAQNSISNHELAQV